MKPRCCCDWRRVYTHCCCCIDLKLGCYIIFVVNVVICYMGLCTGSCKLCRSLQTNFTMSTRYTSLSLLLSIVDTLSLLLTSFTISLCAPYSCLYLILLDTLNSTRYFQLIARTSFGCSIVWALCLSWWAVPCYLSAYFL